MIVDGILDLNKTFRFWNCQFIRFGLDFEM